ncbi:MAG: penicillin acylase family protein [Gemmatimonadales bacterium]|nr:MAG: penicillin acylase family protein [Gemmatimonadales bacterium]
MNRIRWALGIILGGGLVAALVAGVALFVLVRGSLPALDGEARLAGLAAPAWLERDSLGIAVIRAESAEDGYRALGFAHGQDRFFQMDLVRRLMGGTLAELVGEPALGSDREMRAYGYADAAFRHLAALPSVHRGALDGYVEGVNAGLASLRRPPPEYLLLRTTPEPWSAEDALLTYLFFYHGLATHYREQVHLRELYRLLPPAVAAFLSPEISRWDHPGATPLPLTELPILAVPSSQVLDLRDRSVDLRSVRGAIRVYGDLPGGSNAWAVGVARGVGAAEGAGWTGGAALVAGDPHLPLQVPAIWYRAEMHAPSAGGSVRGVTLPGVPGFFVGMTDRVAWSPTAAMVDQTDLVEVEVDPSDPTRYRVPEGWESFQLRHDTLRVAGGRTVPLERRSTRWGPVIRVTPDGVPLALRSPAFDAGGLTLEHLGLPEARDVHEVAGILRTIGGPSLAVVAGDAGGRVLWGVAGVLPGREGTDGRRPVGAERDEVAWPGPRPEAERPLVVDSLGGVVVTANHRFAPLDESRTLSGIWLSPTRATRIHQLLDRDARPDEELHHQYQLDTHSLEHEEVRRLVLDLIPENPSDSVLARIRTQADQWDGRANAGSVPFRTLEIARRALRDAALAPLLAPVVEEVPGFRYTWLLAHEAAFRLLEERPEHLLPRAVDGRDVDSWESYLTHVLREAVIEAGGPEVPWGQDNRAAIAHPISGAVPLLARFLDMPRDPLPGWAGAVRAQTPTYGQSLRFVGRPGHPEQAILDVPGGQSGHFLSPWYQGGHRSWVEGGGGGLVSGPAEHRLRLVP